jgi:RHS repeat-associated protein
LKKARKFAASSVVRTIAVIAVLNLSIPTGAIATVGKPIADNWRETEAARKQAETRKQAKDEAAKAKNSTRPLTASEQRSFKGMSGRNPYLAGQNKWDIVHKGVNLMTGNYTVSATDLSFEGGYGIPVNVTRSYSMHSMDEGPFGMGWTLSADVRSTAGGLLKSSGAPVRSVPVTFKERPSAQLNDPNAVSASGKVAADPPVAVIATDAGGQEETIQKDVDGVLSTPPWDKNVIDTEYEWVTLGTDRYQVALRNTLTTADGTIYVYEKKGYYTNGTRPWNNSSATPEAANVLKVTSATDRQGSVTTYGYGTTDVTFQKANGQVTEKPLTSVYMPNGRTLLFNWTGNRITQVSDKESLSDTEFRTVNYGYTNGNLTSVTTPAGFTTTYGYGTFNGVVTSITDSRGFTTNISVVDGGWGRMPSGVSVDALWVDKITFPNGAETRISGLPRVNGVNVVSEWVKGTQIHKFGYVANYTTLDQIPVCRVAVPREFHDAAGDYTENYYNRFSQDLITGISRRYGTTRPINDLSGTRLLDTNTLVPFAVRTDTTYNFMGNPLTKVESEYTGNAALGSTNRTRQKTVEYAYWGQEKYWQQKAIRDVDANRYSFTDYYPSTAAGGAKGQTYRVYDAKYATYNVSSNPLSTWRSTILPNDVSKYSAEFTYDSLGRSTLVKKIQSATTNPYTYVSTATNYGSNGSPGWGQPQSVTEDYGGPNARTTTTLEYTGWGKARKVQDAKGNEFYTDFDLDGKVLSVQQTAGTGAPKTLVSYSYGTSGILNGMPTQVVDGLSGVTQSIQYFPYAGTNDGSDAYYYALASAGQVQSVTQTRGTAPNQDTYTTAYTYTFAGDRRTAEYTSFLGTNAKWEYSDYVSVGDLTSPSRAFQTLRKVNPDDSTAEVFHYGYDALGRLCNAAFAQTPQLTNGVADWSKLPSVRARSYNEFDSGGRLVRTETYKDTLNGAGTNYTSTPIIGNEYGYELTGANRGLRTSTTSKIGNGGAWQTEWSDTYGYEAQRDYLTSFSTTDGASSPNQTWSYDAAGNRAGATYDSLNRMTARSTISYTNDVLGNRTSRTYNGVTVTYAWDVLNRMTQHTLTSGAVVSYEYRADGMRTRKLAVGTGQQEILYLHDGQNPVEEATFSNGPTRGAYTEIVRNGLGARGIDYVEVFKTGSATSVRFPVYDGHGNMTACLLRDGAGGFTLTSRRAYDPWGAMRQWGTHPSGASAYQGAPSNRYVGSLGHQQDDDSGLYYMRARYYEPGSGRFISEDPAMDGLNWFAYCGNDPVNYADDSGCARVQVGGTYWIEWQKKDGDLAWGKGNRQLGQYVGNGEGRLKHPKDEKVFNQAIKKLLLNASNPKVLRTLAKAGDIGLRAAVLTCSLDSAFLSNPAEFADMIDYVGGEWDLLSGFVTVSASPA